ncbi:ParB/RepB/Spo0J family partition protein [Anaerosalibacter sp. Marseille-P3206]|uniref:ParB/RepB/Spo0J family partition protein n=1 Tax=Anaerosalibacter sp. Marseille-P3206 TaxID=1871005 RepID=UPI0009871CD3|nr:ParB/RepB/Spo0J family partition protein [Anaerosalibacter sp. Marseille-P3206]
MAKKRGLGKGLSALIPDEPIEEFLEIGEEKDSITNIDISLIKPNKNQPRKEFDEEGLEELSHSIKSYGIIQPIIVRKVENKYEIVAGERRWKASQLAGLKEVPCLVRDIEDFEAMKLALIENIQREDLNPIEEARAFKELMDKYKLKQEELSQVVGKSRSYIANTLRLLNLDNETLNLVEEGKITSGHGRALLSIKNQKERKRATDEIIGKKLNVRQTEDMAKQIKINKSISSKRKDPIVVELEENLMSYLGTKVKIIYGKDKGKIEIEYYGEEDLERILDAIIEQ